MASDSEPHRRLFGIRSFEFRLHALKLHAEALPTDYPASDRPVLRRLVDAYLNAGPDDREAQRRNLEDWGSLQLWTDSHWRRHWQVYRHMHARPMLHHVALSSTRQDQLVPYVDMITGRQLLTASEGTSPASVRELVSGTGDHVIPFPIPPGGPGYETDENGDLTGWALGPAPAEDRDLYAGVFANLALPGSNFYRVDRLDNLAVDVAFQNMDYTPALDSQIRPVPWLVLVECRFLLDYCANWPVDEVVPVRFDVCHRLHFDFDASEPPLRNRDIGFPAGHDEWHRSTTGNTLTLRRRYRSTMTGQIVYASGHMHPHGLGLKLYSGDHLTDAGPIAETPLVTIDAHYWDESDPPHFGHINWMDALDLSEENTMLQSGQYYTVEATFDTSPSNYTLINDDETTDPPDLRAAINARYMDETLKGAMALMMLGVRRH